MSVSAQRSEERQRGWQGTVVTQAARGLRLGALVQSQEATLQHCHAACSPVRLRIVSAIGSVAPLPPPLHTTLPRSFLALIPRGARGWVSFRRGNPAALWNAALQC